MLKGAVRFTRESGELRTITFISLFAFTSLPQ